VVPPEDSAPLHRVPAAVGYGSREGALLATGSQTRAWAHVFDGEDDPRMEEWRRSIARAAAEGGTRD